MPQADGQSAGETSPSPIWVRVRRSLLLRGLGQPVGGGAVSGLLVLADRSVVSALLVACAITYSMRFAIHLHLGYHHQEGREGRRLAVLTRADAVIGACFNAGAATCLCSEPPGSAVVAFALGLFLAVLLVSGATVAATRDSQIQRGSEWVRGTAVFAWLATSLDPHSELFGKPFLWLIRQATPVRSASCYIVCVLAILLSVAVAESAATIIKPVRDVAHFER